MIELQQEPRTTTIRIYACGGAGVNIVSQFKMLNGSLVKISADSFSTIHSSFIDTSRSDLNHLHSEDEVYVIPGLDGQGKKRGLSIEPIRNHIPDIMFKHAPEEINIVVHSAGGGSGAVLGPLIVNEIMKRGLIVVPIVVECTSSAIEVKNTLDTLMSYANFSKSHNKPLVMSWHEQKLGKSMTEVDNDIKFIIAILSTMFSGNNRKLDSADLKNWLDYTKVTGFEPELAMLRVSIPSESYGDVATACTLLPIGVEPPSIDVPYHCYGYMPEDVSGAIMHGGVSGPVVSTVRLGAFDAIAKRLQASNAKHIERMSVRKASSLGSAGADLVF